MSFFIRNLSLPFLSATAATYGAKKLDENFGAKGEKELAPGTKIENNGKTQVVIGYFGAEKKVTHNPSLEREIYFGSKAEAQKYAENRATVEKGTATVALVVGDELPKPKHLSPGAFGENGGPNPLSPKGLRKLNVQVIKPEEVNDDTRLGTFANLKRMKDYYKTNK